MGVHRDGLIGMIAMAVSMLVATVLIGAVIYALAFEGKWPNL